MSKVKTEQMLSPTKVERLIASNRKFLCTIFSYASVLAFFINLNSLQSAFIGTAIFVIYFTINAVFLGNVFFNNEKGFFRLALGVLLLIMLLGFVGWFIMIVYNLDAIMLTLALAITTTLASLLNIRMRHYFAE